MKVVFLDIDGVLNSNFWNDSHNQEISDGTLIEEEKVRLLATLVKNTEAKVILHSGWKYWFNESLIPVREESKRLDTMLKKHGVTIAGITPDHATEEIRKTRRFSLVKAGEILEWVASHDDVETWVVIDDLELHNDEVTIHQVRTDPEVGLTESDVRRVEEILGEKE